MQELIQLLTNGIADGSIYALGALGATVLFGVLNIGNFAYGDYMTVGAFCALGATTVLGLPFALALIVGAVGTAIMSVGLDFALFRPLRRKGAGAGGILILSVGLALAIRYTLYLFFGASDRAYSVNDSTPLRIGSIRISTPELVTIATTLVLVPCIAFLFQRTRVGKSMRAVASNPDLAAVSGVDLGRVSTYTWAVSGALAGVAGVLLALLQGAFDPQMGWQALFFIFAAVILGGIGSAYGALIAGFALGIVTDVAVWSGFGGGLPLGYKPVLAFGLLILVLLIRPQGVFGRLKLR
jgi:branched-subunit amino acid ABC-type transport system permease component